MSTSAETLRKLGAPVEVCAHCGRAFPAERPPIFFSQLMVDGEPAGVTNLLCSATCVTTWCSEQTVVGEDGHYIPMLKNADGRIRAVAANEGS